MSQAALYFIVFVSIEKANFQRNVQRSDFRFLPDAVVGVVFTVDVAHKPLPV